MHSGEPDPISPLHGGSGRALESWFENGWRVGRRSIPGGAQWSRDSCSGDLGYLGGSGGGLQSDFVAEGLKLANMVALLTFWVDA
jgi:hypothetical protein